MRKVLAIAILLAMVGGVAIAQDSINLGDFPIGKWLDANYGAVWEFSSSNIRILDTGGNVFWDFSKEGVQDFKVVAEAGGIGISFSCEAAGLSGKSYKFLKGITDSLSFTIKRAEFPDYNVQIPKQ